jgi:hypothetical protein
MPTYYGLVSYQMHARMKEKKKEPPQLISCKSQILSTCNPPLPYYLKVYNANNFQTSQQVEIMNYNAFKKQRMFVTQKSHNLGKDPSVCMKGLNLEF